VHGQASVEYSLGSPELGVVTAMVTQIVIGLIVTVGGGLILSYITQKIHRRGRTLSVLADAIYQVLRRRVPHVDPTITYSQLVSKLPSPHNKLAPDDGELFGALADITRVCRKRGLPTLAALVVRAIEKTPGQGYYAQAHPQVSGNTAPELAAWRLELETANRTDYPPML